MVEYNPSKIIKDGNTYNFRDTTKIPLAGSNQISGSLIPATDNSIDIGSSTKNIKVLYSKDVIVSGSGNGLKMNSSSEALFIGNTLGAGIDLCGKDYTINNNQGKFILSTYDGVNYQQLIGAPDGTLTWNGKNLAMQEDFVPRSGGAVINGSLMRSVDNDALHLAGGSEFDRGADIWLFGNAAVGNAGAVQLMPSDGTRSLSMWLNTDGTWTWGGTAVQLVSDQRLKQQISQIDDKLLDAWEDVNLVQFKYNDAVKEKSDKARLHTGYVVQQIDSACKSHGVDVSQYGLYCHEEYPQETEEVEVERADGTKVKERKVIREASEHYSLRYTEVYAVECMYLRRCIKQLTARIEELEKGNNTK